MRKQLLSKVEGLVQGYKMTRNDGPGSKLQGLAQDRHRRYYHDLEKATSLPMPHPKTQLSLPKTCVLGTIFYPRMLVRFHASYYNGGGACKVFKSLNYRIISVWFYYFHEHTQSLQLQQENLCPLLCCGGPCGTA